jgi:hypothetical protein
MYAVRIESGNRVLFIQVCIESPFSKNTVILHFLAKIRQKHIVFCRIDKENIGLFFD